MFGIGPIELIVLVAVVLLVVGPAKAPGIARSLGKGVREVRESVEGTQRELKEAVTGREPDERA